MKIREGYFWKYKFYGGERRIYVSSLPNSSPPNQFELHPIYKWNEENVSAK